MKYNMDTRKKLASQTIRAFILSAFISACIHSKLIKDSYINHSVYEEVCILMVLSLFISLLYSFDINPSRICMLAFGYAALSAFDTMHTIEYLKRNTGLDGTFDPSAKLWILWRIAETMVLLLTVALLIIKYSKLKTEKQEQAKNCLQNLSENMNDVLDSLPVGVQKYDCNGRLVYMNSKFEEMIGCDRKELCGKTYKQILRMFSETDKEKRSKNKSVQRVTKCTGNIVRTFRNMKGEKIRLNIKVQRLKDEILLIVNDAKKEQELEIINMQTQTILNAVSNGMVLVDRKRRIVLCNEAVEKILEMSHNEIIGLDVNSINEALRLEIRKPKDNGLLKKDEGNANQLSITTKSGNEKEIHVYVKPIKNVDGEIIGDVIMITDITNIKNEQQRMIQQEKLAMLGQMGAGIVHETRNYLTTIKGSCQLINMITKEENTRKHTENINRNVDEVNRIISEFLFLSKPREPEMVEVSLYDIFESVKSMIETSSLVKGVDIDIRISKEERYMLCDEAQIKQVILNLCKNAIDAMAGKKNGKIIVDTGYDESTNEMYVKVIDNGRGISEEELKNIGKPFFTTKKTGTGLGLSVCYGIVEKHGGRIEVKSKIGKGTTFTVFLPCITDEEDEEVEIDPSIVIVENNELLTQLSHL